MIRLSLGTVDQFAETPRRVSHGSRTYFVVRGADGFHLLSGVCPHQGGAVFDEGSRFECPVHGWRFDRVTGRCLNAPSRALSSFPVQQEDGRLYAMVPGDTGVDGTEVGNTRSRTGLTIQLHAHACLEIRYGGFTLLTDPWLNGPAFFGAWAPYPPPRTNGADLRPDVILITHEHSDHFHEPTLRLFDRRTPMLVPDFPNRRLIRRLRDWGFTAVTAIPFGQPCVIHDRWQVTAFEAESYWNDAFFLIDIDGFRILNSNDAGINARIANLVAPVDLLAAQFSGGASGYPWTWNHLSHDQKVALSAQACTGKLKMIGAAVDLYRATAVLPFASHFTLWHPSHRQYGRAMRRNSLEDVKQALGATEVIDLLAGETWDVGAGVIRRGDLDRGRLYQTDRMEAYMASAVSPSAFAVHFPVDESLTLAELTRYLEQLNRVPDIVHCEDLTVRIRGVPAESHRPPLDVALEVTGGRLGILAAPPELPNLSIEIPLALLTAIIREGHSWDEAFIGYWCRFDRHPNVYHAGFWRLLQAPYYMDPAHGGRHRARVERDSSIADVLERGGAAADRILRRYGLYCAGCQHSIAESIESAGRSHGIEPLRIEMLVRELGRVGQPDAAAEF